MKKITFLFVALMLGLISANAATDNNYFSEDFYRMSMQSDLLTGDWVTYGNEAALATYSNEVYNMSNYFLTPGEDGEIINYKLINADEKGYAFSCTNFADPNVVGDQWLITPEFEIKDDAAILLFYTVVYTFKDVWGNEKCPIEVLISETGTAKEDFTSLTTFSVGSTADDKIQAKKTAVRLNDRKGKKVHLAFVTRGKDCGLVGFTNITVGNYAIDYQNNTARTSTEGKEVVVEINVGVKAPQTCSAIDVTLEYNDVKVTKKLEKAFGSTSSTVVYMLCAFDEDPIKIGKESINYTVTVLPEFEGALPYVIYGTIAVPSKYYPSNVVVEEATATGCGFCPRGIAALEYFHKNYPGSETQGKAINIGVHGLMDYYDPMSEGVSDYLQGLYAINGNTSLPQASFNRATKGKDPSDVSAFQAQFNNPSMFKAGITKIEYPTNPKWGDKVTVKFVVNSSFTATGVPTLCAVVITEDNVKGNVSGYNQHNYFYRYEKDQAMSLCFGPIMEELSPFCIGGAFAMESIPFSSMTYQHVARGIYPEFLGKDFASKWDENYANYGEITFELPETITSTSADNKTIDVSNLNAVVLIMDPLEGYKIIASDILGFTETPSTGVVSVKEAEASAVRNGDLLTVKTENGSTAQVYSVDGVCQATAVVNGEATIELNNSGIVIVRISTPNGVKTIKL